ncbi:S8 family peptidase [Paenibacillus marinisediminis]
MRGGTIVGVAVLCLGFLTIPMLTACGNTVSKPPTNNTVKSVSEERNSKQHVLQQDVLTTQKIFTHDTEHDMKSAVQEWQSDNGKQLEKKLKQFVAEHPHFEYVKLVNKANNQTVSSGKIAHDMNNESGKKLESYLKTAQTSLDQQKPYRSPEIIANGKRHAVLSWPDSRINGGIIAIVNGNIVKNVEAHQQRNLRLVPYPREDKYRVESVNSNTMKDVKVKNGEDNQGTSHYHKFEVVVRFRSPLSDADLNKIKQDIQCTDVRQSGYTYVFRSKSLDSARLEQYFSQYNPLYIEPHYLYMTNDEKRPDGTPTSLNAPTISPKSQTPPSGTVRAAGDSDPNDVLYKPYQWELPLIKTNAGWNISKGNNDVIIAVVDTGVDVNHKDLKGKLIKGFNVINPGQPPNDDVGHGTHVAGTIGAHVNNLEGIAGMTWYSPIMPVKVLDNTGAGSSYAVAEGIIYAADHGAKVINMSLGNYAQSAFLQDAVQYAFDKDVVIVAATGNDNTSQPGYPAAYPQVFAVSATDKDLSKASYSNFGDYVDVVAPGTNIASTYPNNQYAALSGTSMASPHVAALAALIRSVNPSLRNTEVYDIMRQSVQDLGTPGKDIYYGYGQIDVEHALNLAKQGTDTKSTDKRFMRLRPDSLFEFNRRAE